MRKAFGVLAAGCGLVLVYFGLAAVLRTLPVPWEPRVRFEASADESVRVMVALSGVGSSDVVFELGCGDGRVLQAALLGNDARGVCVEISSSLAQLARERFMGAGMAHRVSVIEGDLFDVPLVSASVVLLFLSPELNLRLLPKLRAELLPGARVVSHYHPMGDLVPDEVRDVSVRGVSRPVYLWASAWR